MKFGKPEVNFRQKLTAGRRPEASDEAAYSRAHKESEELGGRSCRAGLIRDTWETLRATPKVKRPPGSAAS
jgi:hypothetical protein